MPQFAGQMLPLGSGLAQGPNWVPANARRFSRFYGGSGGTYFARIGWRSGMVGIGMFMIPNSPGWQVLMDDYPGGTTLPPGTPDAGNPPTSPPGAVAIGAVGASQPAGPVAVGGTVAPSATAVQAAQVIGGNPGAFTGMTVTGTTWNGSVTCSVGSRQIRVRQTNQQFIYADSNTFTVS